MIGYSLAHQNQAKPIGSYLLEAGLLSQGQIDVALADQQYTDMTFGEIVATRGWVKQQTIDYLMQKVVLPERDMAAQQQQQIALTSVKPERQPLSQLSAQAKVNQLARQKLMTASGSDDNDVQWLG